ncbi:MAG: hypothetical protein ACRDJW_18015 [Thermomicrobiales bacterium]
MGEASEPTTGAMNERLTWHPDYRGKTVTEVAAEVRADLEHDQRAYALALESADERENDTLAAILTLDKKWSDFDMGWIEADTATLAQRIAAFEHERDRRRDLFPFADLRDHLAASLPEPTSDRPWWAFWRR